MPDGTSLGGTPSILNQRMNALGISTDAWQLQFRKAAAVWESVANVQLAMVSDDGSPLGVAGNQQGDARFGDIRIGGYSQNSPYQLAYTFGPPPGNGGTLAGDLLMNTDQPWRVDGVAFDLQTVAIHELGHSLGMSHSAISAADMYAYYNYTKTTATSDDIAGIRSIYGPIPADPLNNNSFANAIYLAPIANAYGQISLGGQSIKDPFNDADYFKVTAPSTTNGTLIVVMQAGQLSSLSPRVLVYNQAQALVGQSSQPYSYGGNAIAVINNVSPGQVFYIRCQAASGDTSGYGAYGLLVNFGGPGMMPVTPPDTVVAQQPDQGGGVYSQSISGAKRKDGGLSPVDVPGQGVIKIGTVQGEGDALKVRNPARFLAPAWKPSHRDHPRGPRMRP